MKCPDGWNLNGKYCYKYFEQKLSWGDAVDHCNVLKGSLVSIECTDDNLYVKGWSTTSLVLFEFRQRLRVGKFVHWVF